MADIIHLLPDFVANQIAAGEVIQRPASIIKELMENSVDAGADKVDVWITDAGKTSIQVVDNGKGMSETDARLAFERHATSKIKESADLFKLHTMGFRGEALASIAAVAQVELKTRTIEDEIGVHLSLVSANIIEQKPVACSVGAQFIVNNIFYNVPARRRFLKSNITEINNIMLEFERVALIHPDIEFTFHRDNVQSIDLRPSSLKKRITDLFGINLDKFLLPVHVETSLVKIDGFVGSPESARTKGTKQFFFVNERYMKHPYFHRAILTAFERLIPTEKQIPYFYCLEVDPSRIDVNIHPTKTEIKFEDEQAIWQIILAVTKEALGKFNAIPSIDFEPNVVPEIPSYYPGIQAPEPILSVDKSYNPFFQGKQPERNSKDNLNNWEKYYNSISKVTSTASDLSAHQNIFSEQKLYNEKSSEEQKEWEQETISCIQYDEKYIITPVKSGLMVIDQHRAHIRILYDKYLSELNNHNGVSQGLLFPELFQVPISQITLLDTLLDDFSAVGFDISCMGGGSYAINGVPAGSEKQNSIELVMKIMDSFDKSKDTKKIVHSSIALTLAKSNAISYFQILNIEEMTHLIEKLLRSSTPKYTPEGKLIIGIIENQKLDFLMK